MLVYITANNIPRVGSIPDVTSPLALLPAQERERITNDELAGKFLATYTYTAACIDHNFDVTVYKCIYISTSICVL